MNINSLQGPTIKLFYFDSETLTEYVIRCTPNRLERRPGTTRVYLTSHCIPVGEVKPRATILYVVDVYITDNPYSHLASIFQTYIEEVYPRRVHLGREQPE